MARGDSGFSSTSMDSGVSGMPSLVHSGYGAPSTVQYSPPEIFTPFTPVPASAFTSFTSPTLVPAKPKQQLVTAANMAEPKIKPKTPAMAFSGPLPTTIGQAVLEPGEADGVMFPPESDNFSFEEYLYPEADESAHLLEAFPDVPGWRRH
jgi:hypothetical protein